MSNGIANCSITRGKAFIQPFYHTLEVRAMDDVTLCFIDSSAAVMPVLLPEALGPLAPLGGAA